VQTLIALESVFKKRKETHAHIPFVGIGSFPPLPSANKDRSSNYYLKRRKSKKER
jgi:hypothetical protein